MSKPEKKLKFRVRAVVRGRSLPVYAKALEKTMNEMNQDGYSVRVVEQKTGALLLGAYEPPPPAPPPNPLVSLFGALQRSAEETAGLSSETRTLLGQVLRLFPDHEPANQQVLVAELQKHLPRLLKGFSIQRVLEMAKELKAYAAAHSCADETCRFTATVHAVVEQMTAATSLHIQ